MQTLLNYEYAKKCRQMDGQMAFQLYIQDVDIVVGLKGSVTYSSSKLHLYVEARDFPLASQETLED